MRNPFRTESPSLDRIIVKSIRRLRVQHARLDQANFRLQQRDKSLFKATTFALEKKNTARASMCANELAEVRKLTKLLSQTQIAIERIILRLETVKELSIIMIDLKPALNSLKGVTTSLVNVMPDIASVLENVNDSIVETLTVTKVTSDPSIIRTDLKTPGGQEILQEVNAVLEERLTESLPQPPISEPLPTLEADQPVRKMVALPVGCPESPRKDSAERAANPEAFFSVEDIELQSRSITFPESA
ncbi:Snf7 family protein, partial [Candidatus Bathyarchaeota archaeon]|nr:Snf7 family protein [Candidatus Bathyarchaeota archaeon]